MQKKKYEKPEVEDLKDLIPVCVHGESNPFVEDEETKTNYEKEDDKDF